MQTAQEKAHNAAAKAEEKKELAQEKAHNVAAKAEEKKESAKAPAGEKLDKATAHSNAEKEQAYEKHLKEAEAAGHLPEKLVENIARTEENKHGLAHHDHTSVPPSK